MPQGITHSWIVLHCSGLHDASSTSSLVAVSTKLPGAGQKLDPALAWFPSKGVFARLRYFDSQFGLFWLSESSDIFGCGLAVPCQKTDALTCVTVKRLGAAALREHRSDLCVSLYNRFLWLDQLFCWVRNHCRKLIYEPEQHFQKREQLSRICLVHQSNFMGCFIPLFANMVDPMLALRGHVSLIRKEVHVFDEF